jgi:dihydrofolate synthase/folylpolyglutamate synthase
MDPLEELFSLEQFGIKFGLENMRAICASLGHPERAWRSVIIAGTNGKGSVAAFVETALRAAGFRTGRYTSPHLVSLEERFGIDGRPVATARMREAVAIVLRHVASLRATGVLDVQPTFFEATTAVAFELFRHAAVDVAVLEVGMGGRLDATNVAEPIAGAITTIDFDHERYLGSTLAAIAFEKAGVIKPGMTVIVGERKPEPVDVIARACRERSATFVAAADGVRASTGSGGERTRLTLRTPADEYGTITLGLLGAHQVDNAIVAVRLLEALREQGLDIPRAAIVTGLEEARWPGRLEWRRLPEGRVLLDAAHNPAGAVALAGYLRQARPAGLPLVFVAMKDKAIAPMLDALLPCATRLIATQPTNRRAADPADVAALARRIRPAVPVSVVPEPAAAVREAFSGAGEACVAGSIFLLGDVISALE